MLAVFYQFNKRVNSLKTPTNSDQTISGEVVLKQATSYKTPTLTFACSSEDMPKARLSNYLAFDNKYYWVTNTMQISNSHIQFECKLDVLATYKNEILLSKCFVIYAVKGNKWITDTRMMNSHSEITKFARANTFDMFNNEGSLIISCISASDASSQAFATNYILNDADINTLRNKLNGSDFIEYAKQVFSNPYDFLIGAFFSSCNYDDELSEPTKMLIGTYDTGIQAIVLGENFVRQQLVSITIPHLYNDFRELAPYASYNLYLPYVGIVHLDDIRLAKSDQLGINCWCQMATGAIIYQLSCDDGTEAGIILGTYTGNCNKQTPIAVRENNLLAGATSIGTIVASLAMPVTGAASAFAQVVGMASGFGGLAKASELNTQINGSLSSNLGGRAGLKPELIITYTNTSENPSLRKDVDGMPLGSTVELNTLTGYVQTMNASISIAADYDEIQEVNDLLNGGVYIE